MEFKPKTESEIAASGLAPKGDYDFDVLNAEDAISQSSGNEMIKIKIGIYIGDSIKHYVYDYLIGSMEAKLRHFCDTVGLLSAYESGSLNAEMCKGRSGRVKIIIDDKDENYPPKNSVKDYIVRAAKPLAKQTEEKDDVPF